jgi:hypothetical protein
MSISRSSEKLPEVKKEKFYKDRHFKKMVINTIKNVSSNWNVFQVALIMLIFISGVGELIGVKFSLFWYIICIVDLIYIIIKDFLAPKEIAETKEGGIPTTEIKK